MFMLNFEKQFPNIDENMDAKEACKVLTNYIYQVMKYLRWALDNLDFSNMTSDFTQQVTNKVAGEVKDELDEGIIQQISNITESYFNNIISQNVVTNTLTAEYGNIARLTVDELRTDYKRAQNYLKGDKSDLNYIYIHDEQLVFITATVNSDEGIPFVSGGKQLYWFDESKSSLTFEPVYTQIVNNQQITVTREQAYVYPYTEYEKGHIKFEQVYNNDGTGTVQPVIVLGTGNGTDNRGKGYINKNVDCFEMFYISRLDGLKYGIRVYDEGNKLLHANKEYAMPLFREYTTLQDMEMDTDLPVGAYGIIGGV